MRWVAMLLVVGWGVAAQAASFDCAKAVRPVEKAICADAGLSAADSAMAAAYRNDLDRVSTDAMEEMRADQVQWLAWVQMVCRAEDPATAQADLVKCLQRPYADRVRLLRGAVTRQDGVSFFLRTQYLADAEPPLKFGVPEYPGFGTLVASWPVADTAESAWVKWNVAVAARMVSLGGPADGPAKAAAGWQDDMAAEADTTLQARLKRVDGNRVSLGISAETMGHGAAHPNEGWETMTWLLDQGRPMVAEDVFAAGAPWQTALAQLCWQRILRQKDRLYPEVKGPEAKELRDVLLDTRNWTLEPDGLHISYPEYALSPRAAQLDDSVIAWAALRGLFAPGFVPPAD